MPAMVSSVLALTLGTWWHVLNLSNENEINLANRMPNKSSANISAGPVLKIDPEGFEASPEVKATNPNLNASSGGLASEAVAEGNKTGEHTRTNLLVRMPRQIWNKLKQKINRSEFQQIPILNTLLAESLRKHPDPVVYQSIYASLVQLGLPAENKAILLDLLAEIATPEALDQLIKLAEQGIDPQLDMLLLDAISRLGDNRWDGKFHEELSPILETAWSNPANSDPALLRTIGTVIAKIGAPEGVGALILTVSGTNKDKGIEQSDRVKQEVAFTAVPQVSNPAAIEVLDARVKLEPIGTPAFEVSSRGLANIGTVKATQKIAAWAQTAPSQGARNLESLLSKIDPANSLQPILATKTLPVQSPAIRTVLDNFAVKNAASAVLPKSIPGK